MIDKLNKLQRGFITIIGISMVVLLTLDGLGRYALGKSISWAEEATRIMFVWGCFLYITLAFISKSHIGFDSLAKLNNFTKRISSIINGICLSAVGAVVMYYGIGFVKQVGKFPLPASNIPIIILYIPGVIAGTAWIIIGLYQVLVTIKS